jgi:prefoldin subunit 5
MLQANNNLQRVQSVKPDIEQLIDQLSTQRTSLDASGTDIKTQIEGLRQLISLAREAANRLAPHFLCILCETTVSIGTKTLFSAFES